LLGAETRVSGPEGMTIFSFENGTTKRNKGRTIVLHPAVALATAAPARAIG
jgi:hypothetical protein